MNRPRGDEALYDAVEAAREHFDRNNGAGREEMGLRILNVAEEAGEAAAAWIGYVGQNPRKGVTHTLDQVGDELADTAVTALIAIASLGLDVAEVMSRCTAKVVARVEDGAA